MTFASHAQDAGFARQAFLSNLADLGGLAWKMKSNYHQRVCFGYAGHAKIAKTVRVECAWQRSRIIR